MTRFEAILNFLKDLRAMGQGVWLSRIFFGGLLIISISISVAILIIAYNVRVEDVVELIRLVK